MSGNTPPIPAPADTLVLFGLHDHLAIMSIFSSPYAMCKRGTSTMPVLGLASWSWSGEQLLAPARGRVLCNDASYERGVLDRWLSRLPSPSGDHKDSAALAAMRFSPTDEQIEGILDRAPSDVAAICWTKLSTVRGWIMAQPSGAEDVCNIYAKSYRGAEHLKQVRRQTQEMVDAMFEVT